ncbi:MAG: bifunctional riboflavin kinase/FAD synthetase [Deltaproteobacteria bacterium]|nr:bifunctional riboflavin kinase/FAD synthetase [Deltaproteobacteria bacterium]MBW2099508.1 bifunctional riboflavin kinase/FAD synthetase [Deltaproteobacteria bacterium]
MELIEGIEKVKHPYKNAVVTIGNFDGVHKGHQALINEIIKKAAAIDGTAIAITFEPHPIRVLKKNNHPPLITRYDQKIELLSQSGLDVLICIPFTREFASISAKEFIEDILINRIGMKAIVIGKDYTFGKNREGNIDFLKKYATAFGFEVIVPDWIQISGSQPNRISSTRIRELVMDGAVEEVVDLLGRNYQIRGKVETGRNRGGKLLGFPTANIKLHDELCPKLGVYTVTVECLGKKFKGVANIGYSPTFDDHKFTVEVHILNFNENIYGQRIRVNFISRLRDEKKFTNIEALSEQIRHDIEKTREILST